MQVVELNKLRRNTDDRWAVIQLWLANGGRELVTREARLLGRGYELDPQDLEQSTLCELYAGQGQAVEDAFAQAAKKQFALLSTLAQTVARREAGHQASRRSRKNRAEKEHFGSFVEDRDASIDANPSLSAELELQRRQLVDALANALDEEERNWLLVRVVSGVTPTDFARMRGTSRQAALKYFSRLTSKLADYMQAASGGDHCNELEATMRLVLHGKSTALTPDERTRIRDHAEHCNACRLMLTGGERNLRAAALMFPLPLMIASGHGEMIAEMFRTSWAVVSQRAAEAAAPAMANPASSSVRPGAVIGVGLAIVAGAGGAYKATTTITNDHKPAAKSTSAASGRPMARPMAAVPLGLVAKERPKPKKARKKKKRSVPAAPAPQVSTPTQSSPASAPATLNDGSAEFAPEGR